MADIKKLEKKLWELDAGAPYIGCVLDDGFDDMPPAMHADITLSRGGTVLIIDAKCYSPHYADGNICKHIVAAFIAVERQIAASGKSETDGAATESVEDIVIRANADDLRAYAETNGILDSADAVRLVADAYAAAGWPHEAMTLLRESDAHPEPYVERYIKDAMSRMEWANDRRAYRGVAADLAHAAGLPGGQDRAQEAASSIRAEYSRGRALIDELRAAGFVVMEA